jgi:hypothetical protein
MVHLSCLLEISRFFVRICYFLPFKWIYAGFLEKKLNFELHVCQKVCWWPSIFAVWTDLLGCKAGPTYWTTCMSKSLLVALHFCSMDRPIGLQSSAMKSACAGWFGGFPGLLMSQRATNRLWPWFASPWYYDSCPIFLKVWFMSLIFVTLQCISLNLWNLSGIALGVPFNNRGIPTWNLQQSQNMRCLTMQDTAHAAKDLNSPSRRPSRRSPRAGFASLEGARLPRAGSVSFEGLRSPQAGSAPRVRSPSNRLRLARGSASPSIGVRLARGRPRSHAPAPVH